MNVKFKNMIRKDNVPFLLMFIVYLGLFISVNITLDDATLFKEYSHLSVGKLWDLLVADYFHWSSRVLVNLVIHVILGKSTLIFSFCNAIVATILSISLSKLFARSNKYLINIVIIGIIILFPVNYLSSAGWMVTFMTYFWPMTFGFVALIPISKIYYNEPFKKWEYIVYSLSLIYAANEEIELLVLMSVYSVFLFYYMVTHKVIKYYYFQLFLLISSFIFTLTTPGNGNRSGSEIINWFPTYKMLDTVDKADIGFFSTMQNIIFDNNLFIMVISALMSFIIFKKYSDSILRFVSLVPTLTLLCFGDH